MSARALMAASALAIGLRASPVPDLRDPASRPVGELRGLLRGPTRRPGADLVTDEAGRLRALELDDLAPLRLRFSIPF